MFKSVRNEFAALWKLLNSVITKNYGGRNKVEEELRVAVVTPPRASVPAANP
jgi:hypothetical protein